MSEETYLKLRDFAEIPLTTYSGTSMPCLVTRVIDGDTVEIVINHNDTFEKHKFRIAGIDAPEIHTKNEAEKAAGKHSKIMLENILERHENECFVEFFHDDKYGRKLGELYLSSDASGIKLSDYMIKNNLAYQYDGGKKKKYCADEKL